jgi:hypothetical protein
MSKATEYNKAITEFDDWFKNTIRASIKSTTRDTLVLKNHVAQLHLDLKAFAKKYPQFSEDGFKSRTEVGIEIKNDLGYGCYIHFFYDEPGKFSNKVTMAFCTKNWHSEFSNINVSNRINLVYRYLAFLVKQLSKFNQLSEMKKDAENEKIKQDRIRELQTKSVEDWMTTLMSNSVYPYRIEHSKAKLKLLVKIGQQQLSIPIYKKTFQKTVPHILETIKQYEDFIKESKIKGILVFDVPSSKNTTWLNDK